MTYIILMGGGLYNLISESLSNERSNNTRLQDIRVIQPRKGQSVRFSSSDDKRATGIQKNSDSKIVTTNDFEIIGITENKRTCNNKELIELMKNDNSKYDRPYLNNKRMYARLIIKRNQTK